IVLESELLQQQLYLNHGVNEPLGMAVTASIRPEQISVSRQPPERPHNWSVGTVTHLAYMGSHTLFQVELPSGYTVQASVPSLILAAGDAPALDDEVFISWSAN